MLVDQKSLFFFTIRLQSDFKVDGFVLSYTKTYFCRHRCSIQIFEGFELIAELHEETGKNDQKEFQKQCNL